MEFEITAATTKDADALSNLVNSAYRGDYSKQGWTTEADLLDGTRTDAKALEEIIRRPGTTILKYTEGNKILGCVELAIHENQLYLGMLTVEPSLQGKGVGKKMLQAAEEFARAKECKSIYMTVISARKELIDWYKRHGYADTGNRKPFDFNDPRFGTPKQKLEFIVMEKVI